MKIAKYIKTYLILFRYSLINATAYRVSFITEILVEIGYSIVLIVFFQVLYSNISEIGGWTYEQVLLLLGANIVSTEILLGAAYIFNLRELPRKIADGDIDVVLLKPINSLFQLSLGTPYFTAFISTLPGFYIMYIAIAQMGLQISLIQVLASIVIAFCGLVIAYSVITCFASLTFLFTNAESLTSLGRLLSIEYTKYPQSIYRNRLRLLFYFILPVVYMSSVPVDILIRGINIELLVYSVVLATVFLTFTYNLWNLLIKNYSSASS